MFSLGDQVCSQKGRRCFLIGDDHDLAGSGHHIDIDDSIDQSLGRCNISIPWPDDLIDPWNRRRPIGKRRDCLNPSDSKDPIHTRQVSGHKNGRADALLMRRCHHDDFLNASDLCRDGSHEDRRRIGGLSAGDIDSHPFEGPDDLSERDPLLKPYLRRFSMRRADEISGYGERPSSMCLKVLGGPSGRPALSPLVPIGVGRFEA